MSNKQQLNLYRIEKSNVIIIAEKEGYEETDLESSEQIIEFILDQVDGRRRPRQLILKQSVRRSFEPLSVVLYFCQIPINFQWQNFFREHLVEEAEENTSFLSFRHSNHASFLCFIYDQEDIFAFTGGLGNSYIKDYVDNEFGISCLEKIGDPNTLQLRMAKNNNIIGNLAADQRFYRGPQKTHDEDKMGKIYNEVVGNIEYSDSLRVLRNLIFDGDVNGRMNVKAKASLCFAKSMSLNDLKTIINFVKSLPDEENFKFSPIRSLNSRRAHEKVKMQNLELLLANKICESFIELRDNLNYVDEDFLEVSHAKFNEFYDSNRIVIRRSRAGDILVMSSPFGLMVSDVLREIYSSDSIFIISKLEEIEQEDDEKAKLETCFDLISLYSVHCYNTEIDIDNPVLEGRLLSFVNCELEDETKPYFRMNSKWYISNENYMEEINTEFTSIFDASEFVFPLVRTWGQGRHENENENTYLEHLAENIDANTLVFHKIIPGEYKIELCDIIHWSEEELYLIHIKPSFDGAVRVLEKQITQSSQFISEDLRNETGYIRRYHQQAANTVETEGYKFNIANSLANISEDEFFNMFKDKKINFVACIVDPKSKRRLREINRFRSNIAKMCMIEAYRSIRKNSLPTSKFRMSEIIVDPAYVET